jgi:hypothetical protein
MRKPITTCASVVCLSAVCLSLVFSSSRAWSQDIDESLDAEFDSKPVPKKDDAKPSTDTKSESTAPQANATPAPGTVHDELQFDEDDLAKTTPGTKDSAKPESDMKTETTPTTTATSPAPSTPEATPQPEPIQAEAPPPTPVVPLFDQPNLELEKKLAKKIQDYKPVDDRRWDELIGNRRSEIYIIQKGDTLSSISDTFFGDGKYWAKLWSQNGGIENPHEIVKGKGIRFIAGTESEAPSVGVTNNLSEVHIGPPGDEQYDYLHEKPVYREEAEKVITQEEVDSGNVVETEEIIASPELPPPTIQSAPVKDVPPSFKYTRAVELAQQYDANGISAPKRKVTDDPAPAFVNSYIVDRNPNPVGTVEEIELGVNLAGVGQNILVKMKYKVPLGSRYTVVSSLGVVASSSRGHVGPVLENQGRITIADVVSESKHVYRAVVDLTANGVFVGSMILAEPPPKADLDQNGPRKEAEVEVVGTEYDRNRKVVGLGSIVYLDGGAQAGLKKGDILGVQSALGRRHAGTNYPELLSPIATIKVVDVRSNVATAIVLYDNEPISVGDRTGGDLPHGLPTIHSGEDTGDFDKKD